MDSKDSIFVEEAAKVLNTTPIFNIYKTISGGITSHIPKRKSKPILGIFLAFLSAIIGSVKGLVVNIIAYIGPIEIFSIRSLGTTFVVLPLVIYSREAIFRDFKTNLWLLLMSVIGNIAVTGYYYGFAYLPMGIASVIYYSCPLYTTIMGLIFLKEPCGVTQFLSIPVLILGLVLVTSPWNLVTGNAYSIPGLVGSIMGAIAQAIVFLILRKLKDIPAVISTTWWSVIGTILSVIILIATKDIQMAKCNIDGYLTVIISILGTLGSLTMTFALSECEAGLVSIVLTSEIVFSFLLQVYFEEIKLEILSVIGGGLILISIIGTFVAKRYIKAK